MEQIIAILAWPGVVLIIGLVAIFVFRTQLGALIQRTKRIGKTGIETYETQPSQPGDDKKAIDEFFRAFDNPLLLEAEQLILKDLKDRKIESTLDREKALVRSLASTNIILHFERVHGLIWASQLSLLRFLNARDTGADIAELVVFYEMGKTGFPDWYESYPFDRWLGFLQSFNLIAKQDSRTFISVAGREFLKYLVASGKSGPAYG
jgi:hypothetical protein